ncbi:hypothetical protein CK203_068614 [Vitis vinifera]|uniref:Uncharacterized protein n=1 Tax=Vitis vinifera TaxID=29760 RepID=A0A438EEQ2_VITVI|nr:hypothetical protein CK203_068614 [Vitis vinifera]
MDANAILAGVVMGQSPVYEPHQFRAIFHTVIACAWGIFLTLQARSISPKKAYVN